MLTRPRNFAIQAVEFADIGEPLPPSALYEIMPTLQFKCSVDLFTAFVAEERAYHRHSVHNKETIQYVLKQIASLLRLAGHGKMVKLREQQFALSPQQAIAFLLAQIGAFMSRAFQFSPFSRVSFSQHTL